jgi:hypothetical protein
MKIEDNGALPFLDVLVTRRLDGTLGHTVYRQPTHTDLHLHAKPEHDPARPRSSDGLTNYVTRKASGRNYSTLSKTSNKTDTVTVISDEPYVKTGTEAGKQKPIGTAKIPFHQAISNKISRLLRKYIRTIHIPIRKTAQMLRSAKDGVKLKIQGVCQIPRECGKVYVGQSRTVEKRCKEHIHTSVSTRKVSSGKT